MENTTHFFIDTETLAKSPNAVVLSLSVVPFSLEDEDVTFKRMLKRGITMKISTREQMKVYGRKLDKSTLDWWAEQDADARAILKPSDEDLSIDETLDTFEKFLEDNDYDRKNSWLLSRGTVFDFGKLETLYENVKREMTYQYNMVNDMRSFVNVLTGVKNGQYYTDGDRTGFIHHDSLHDAASDAMTLIEIYRMAMAGEL